MSDIAWQAIFEKYRIHKHDFSQRPYFLSADQIKAATQRFKRTSDREVRILCKQDHRDERPQIFLEHNLFILPVKNGEYALLRGEGYVDIPEIEGPVIDYSPQLPFPLYSSHIGNSEMQHLDYAYAISIIRDFVGDPTLVLTIRGRKYTPPFDFYFGRYKEPIHVASVQTEVDAGYEGKEKLVLVEAKNRSENNVIIRQLYYPFRQWTAHVPQKSVSVIFFEKNGDEYKLWLFEFEDPQRYDSIKLLRSARYRVRELLKNEGK